MRFRSSARARVDPRAQLGWRSSSTSLSSMLRSSLRDRRAEVDVLGGEALVLGVELLQRGDALARLHQALNLVHLGTRRRGTLSGCRQGVPWVGRRGESLARAQFGRGRRAAGESHLHLRGAQAAAAAPRAVGLRRLRAGLDVLPQLAAGELGPAVAAHATMTIWHSRARWPHMSPRLPTHWHPPLRKVQNDCRFATRRSGEPVWEHLRGLDLGAALGARGRAVYPFGDAGAAEYMPVATGATRKQRRRAFRRPGGSDLRICGNYPHGVRRCS